MWYSAPLGRISEENKPDDVSAMTEPTHGYGGGERGGVPRTLESVSNGSSNDR